MKTRDEIQIKNKKSMQEKTSLFTMGKKDVFTSTDSYNTEYDKAS